MYVFIFDSFIWWKSTHKLLFSIELPITYQKEGNLHVSFHEREDIIKMKRKCTGLNSLIWMEWRVKLCVENIWTMKCLCNLAIISEQGCNFWETNLTSNFVALFADTKSHLNTSLQENDFKEHWSNFHND